MTDWRKSSYSTNNGQCVEASAEWRKSKSSHTTGNCVEVSMQWAKSSHSTFAGNCVEVNRPAAGTVRVRDSKDAASPELVFSAAAWAGFTDWLKSTP
jgi:hypothetical protein